MNLAPYPDLARVVGEQLRAFPEHAGYLEKRFRDETPDALDFANTLAVMIERVCHGDLATVCSDYRWFSGILLEEEMFFRRNGRYRLSTFAEAVAEVYDNHEHMTRGMNGLLVSQLWWRNHTEVMRYFRDTFLDKAPDGFTHLEVGPGHGLLLALAASSGRCARAEGWDVSASSLTSTREALDGMGVPADKVTLKAVNIFDASDATAQDLPEASFQSITFSEVLEHLEDPAQALRALARLLAPGGRIFVNAPVNSPAPEHIYLFRTPEEVEELVRAAGLEIEDSLFAPCTGATLDRARRLNLTISTAVIARK